MVAFVAATAAKAGFWSRAPITAPAYAWPARTTDPSVPTIRICNTVCVLKGGHFFREEIAYSFFGFGIAISPERLHRVECAADAFLVSIAILNDNALNSIGMSECNSVPDGRPVVLNIELNCFKPRLSNSRSSTCV